MGNVTALINESQAVVARYLYDPFGNIVASSGPLADANRYRFSSKELHPNSGLVYYGYRFYEPSLQRWINRDPIGVRGGVNLYAFVGNGPLGMLDPFGLEGGWKSIGLTYGDQGYRFDYRSPSFVLPDPDPDRRPNYLVYNMAVGWGADPLMRQTYRVFGPGQTPLFTEQSAWTSFLEQEAWREANKFDWARFRSTLDALGWVDQTGFADLANAILYAGSGELGNAFISALSILPGGDSAKALRLADNARRGNAFENAVRNAIGIGDRLVVRGGDLQAISDGYGGVRHLRPSIIEVKDAKYIAMSDQFRAYDGSRLPIHLIVSPRNEGISKQVRDLIEESGGSISVFDPVNKTLQPWRK